MRSNQLNQALIKIVGLGWAAFAIAAIAIRVVLAAPDVVLLVDRSYCEPSDWAVVADTYQDLYQQDQRGQINLESVILFSDLGEEVSEPLSPEAFRNLNTYGQLSPGRQNELTAQYPDARLLQCP
ncbi:hypothetical protein [Leptolyngbya iicbica]|uniref:Uncharacterized protein n=2 Tax=Cyanophyceae TaxID=3028117 RepID=A0A4Q7DYN6_9CYAN|nr:hypothetical protein [Leptolyngbya sp. LK]RZM74378.1 hypothetical protein DYY88_23785 [Leptolyngbya sp. LK]